MSPASRFSLAFTSGSASAMMSMRRLLSSALRGGHVPPRRALCQPAALLFTVTVYARFVVPFSTVTVSVFSPSDHVAVPPF